MIYSIIDIAYREISKIKDMIDTTKSGNNKALTISRMYDKEANEKFLEKFLKEQYIHKFSWKWWGNDVNAPLNIKTKDGKIYCAYLHVFQKDLDKVLEILSKDAVLLKRLSRQRVFALILLTKLK